MVRTSTWQNIGTDVTGASSIHDALATAGLDFTVSKQPIYSKFGNRELLVPGRLATMRDDTGEILGVVGDEYRVCQNSDAFDFVDYVSKDLILEKAGATKSGMMYVIGKLPDVSILGDTFTPHLIFQNGFNGGYTVKAAICPLRIICQNQFAVSFRNANNAISIRHSASLSDRLEAAKETFLETAEYMKELTRQAEILAAKKFSSVEFGQFITTNFPITEKMSDLQKQRVQEARAKLWKAYNEPDNANFVGTAWGAVNAIADTSTHKDPIRKSKNFEDSQFISATFNPILLQAIYDRVSA